MLTANGAAISVIELFSFTRHGAYPDSGVFFVRRFKPAVPPQVPERLRVNTSRSSLARLSFKHLIGYVYHILCCCDDMG
jgi:hypothetical protein